MSLVPWVYQCLLFKLNTSHLFSFQEFLIETILVFTVSPIMFLPLIVWNLRSCPANSMNAAAVVVWRALRVQWGVQGST